MDAKTTRKSGSNPDLLSPIPKSKLGFSDSALHGPPYSCLTSALNWLRFPAIFFGQIKPLLFSIQWQFGRLTWFVHIVSDNCSPAFSFSSRRYFPILASSNSNTALGMSDGFMHRTCPSHFIRRFLMVKGIRSHFAMDDTNSLGRSCPFWRLNFWGQILLLAV